MKQWITASGLAVDGLPDGADGRSASRLASVFSSLLDSFRQARADRALRADLAALDDAILRDIGVADDELARIHAQEDFTPRSWSA